MRRLDGLPKKSRWPSAADRFAKHFIPEPNSGCWLWLLSVNEDGYGSMHVNGVHYAAHRAALILHGRDVHGLEVLHSCDTPSCVNPDHLSLGTHQENMADMVRKKRRAPTIGDKNPRAKLSEPQVREILSSTATAAELADRFSVTKELIYQIRNRKCWAHIEVDHDRA